MDVKEIASTSIIEIIETGLIVARLIVSAWRV
jgi:hypothetical protein